MQNVRTPSKRVKNQVPKSTPTPGRGPSERLTKNTKVKGNAQKITSSSPKGKVEKESEILISTPPKPGPSGLRLSISNSKISLNGQKSALESLDASTSSDGSSNIQSDTLDKLPELTSDELDTGVSKIEIPEDIRREAGQNWRLKEAILNSFHFGKNSIHSHEFARSDSDKKTAEVLASSDHTLESKKYRVKLHLGRFSYYYYYYNFLSVFIGLELGGWSVSYFI